MGGKPMYNVALQRVSLCVIVCVCVAVCVLLYTAHKKKVGGSGIVFVLVKTLQKTLQQSAIMRRRHRPTRAKRTTPPLSMPTTIGAPHKTRCTSVRYGVIPPLRSA